MPSNEKIPHRCSFAGVLVALAIIVCASQVSAQGTPQIEVAATPNPGLHGEPIVVEISGLASCHSVPSQQTVVDGVVRYLFGDNCQVVPTGQYPFREFSILPPEVRGIWAIEVVWAGREEVLATTEVRVLDPKFSVTVVPNVSTQGEAVSVTLRGMARNAFLEDVQTVGNTIRIVLGACDPECTSATFPTPFEEQVFLEPLTEGVHAIELYLESVLVAMDSIEVRADGSCIRDATTLCLGNGRFRVTAEWALSNGASSAARAIEETEDTGLFWFFDEKNVELVVKVLDACSTEFESHWVYAAGLTDVGVTLTVTDTLTDVTRVYENSAGHRFTTITDTDGFKSCS